LLYARCSEEADCAECVKAFEGKCEHLPQKLIRREHGIDSFPALSRVMQKADVRGDVDFLSSDSNLWHFHPVGFYRHYSRLMLAIAHIANLRMVQERVVALVCLKPRYGRGIWGLRGNIPRGNTFCNHAVFLTIVATDGRYHHFTGRQRSNPNSRDFPFPDALTEETKRIYDNEGINRSNFWCDRLVRFANEGKLVELTPTQAQDFGNMGYTVLGSHRARASGIRTEVSPHFATVMPGYDFNVTYGPMVANVGTNNLIERAGHPDTFGRSRYNATKWYYNPNQEFRLDIRWIEHLESRPESENRHPPI
jgi:hypothetical protein